MVTISSKLVKEIENSLKACDFQYTDNYPLTTAEIFRGLLKEILRETKKEL